MYDASWIEHDGMSMDNKQTLTVHSSEALDKHSKTCFQSRCRGHLLPHERSSPRRLFLVDLQAGSQSKKITGNEYSKNTVIF